MSSCNNCHVRYANRPGTLCGKCYTDPEIRAKFPSLTKGNRKVPHEQTEAELDQMIAEQSQNLPKWWGKDSDLIRSSKFTL